MKLKKRRQKVWCCERPMPIREYGGNMGIMHVERKKNNVFVKNGSRTKLPSKITCPLCKKRFKPRVRMCHDEGCWHVYLPAHKKMV